MGKRDQFNKFPNIPNKLQKERTTDGKCKYVHKYMRFSGKNKTYRTDVYYCALCGHKVKIEEIFGKYTKCWHCNEPFNIPVGMIKLKPTCHKCTSKDNKHKTVVVPNNDWLDSGNTVEKGTTETIDKDKFIEELLKDARII